MAKTTANTAPNATDTSKAVDFDGSALNFSEWTEQQIGFAPYWNPIEGEYFVGQLLARDERDPEFVRYLVQASIDTKCSRGPKDEAEEVIVKAGEQFTISVYSGLDNTFKQYLDFGVKTGEVPPMYVQAVKKSKLSSDSKKSFWNFQLKVPPKFDKALIDFRRTHGLGPAGAAKSLPKSDAPTKREMQS